MQLALDLKENEAVVEVLREWRLAGLYEDAKAATPRARRIASWLADESLSPECRSALANEYESVTRAAGELDLRDGVPDSQSRIPSVLSAARQKAGIVPRIGVIQQNQRSENAIQQRLMPAIALDVYKRIAPAVRAEHAPHIQRTYGTLDQEPADLRDVNARSVRITVDYVCAFYPWLGAKLTGASLRMQIRRKLDPRRRTHAH